MHNDFQLCYNEPNLIINLRRQTGKKPEITQLKRFPGFSFRLETWEGEAVNKKTAASESLEGVLMGARETLAVIVEA